MNISKLTRTGIRTTIVAAAFAVAAAAPASADFAPLPAISGTDKTDRLWGSNGAEIIDARGGADLLFGRQGADILSGGGDKDQIYPGPGADTVSGGDGLDWIEDDDGNSDTLLGGGGMDLIVAADGAADSIDCGTGLGDIAFADAIDTVVGCEQVVTSTGATTDWWQYVSYAVMGTNNTEALDLAVGPWATGVFDQYRVFGKAGNDLIKNASRVAHIYLGDGVDIGYGSSANDSIYDDDNDHDWIRGLGGNDTVYSANGTPDTIDCGAGTSDIAWADSDDVFIGCEHIYTD